MVVKWVSLSFLYAGGISALEQSVRGPVMPVIHVSLGGSMETFVSREEDETQILLPCGTKLVLVRVGSEHSIKLVSTGNPNTRETAHSKMSKWEDKRQRECFIGLVFGTLHCHFSFPFGFSTDWKTTNERVYIFSSCLWLPSVRPAGERGLFSLSKALAVSPPSSSSLSGQTLRPAKPLSPAHSPFPGVLCVQHRPAAPPHVLHCSHLPSLPALLSFLFCFERGRCRGGLGLCPFHSASALGFGPDCICPHFCTELKRPCRRMSFCPLTVLLMHFLSGLLQISCVSLTSKPNSLSVALLFSSNEGVSAFSHFENHLHKGFPCSLT